MFNFNEDEFYHSHDLVADKLDKLRKDGVDNPEQYLMLMYLQECAFALKALTRSRY